MQLTSSLLIIASSRPPVVPTTTQPDVRVLRLRYPVTLEDGGATRFVDVLEWAEQVARLWRRDPVPHIQELIEEISYAESSETILTTGRVRYSVAPGSLTTPSSPFSSQDRLSNYFLSSDRQLAKHTRKKGSISLPRADPDQRPFDAILNIVPSDLSDKAILKHTILSTTLSRPYLVAASPSPSSKSLASTRFRSDSVVLRASAKVPPSATWRWSLFRRSTSASNSIPSRTERPTYSRQASVSRGHEYTLAAYHSLSTMSDKYSKSVVAALERCQKSRIIHVLSSPAMKISQNSQVQFPTHAQLHPHLIRSIEAFLLSFSFPIGGIRPNDPDSIRARPYLIPASALNDMICVSPSSPVDEEVATQGEWTLAELLLCGALEPITSTVAGLEVNRSSGGKQKEKESGYSWATQRAWIAGVSEIVVRVKPGEQAETRPSPKSEVIELMNPAKSRPSPKTLQLSMAMSLDQKRLPTPPTDSDLSPSSSNNSLRTRPPVDFSRVTATPLSATGPKPIPKDDLSPASTSPSLTFNRSIDRHHKLSNLPLPTPPGSDEASSVEALSASAHSEPHDLDRPLQTRRPSPQIRTPQSMERHLQPFPKSHSDDHHRRPTHRTHTNPNLRGPDITQTYPLHSSLPVVTKDLPRIQTNMFSLPVSQCPQVPHKSRSPSSRIPAPAVLDLPRAIIDQPQSPIINRNNRKNSSRWKFWKSSMVAALNTSLS